MSSVGTTQWIVLDPNEVRVHEFHLRLRSRPEHLALVGATLRAVQVSREDDRGNRDILNQIIFFEQTSVEQHPEGLRTDYELDVGELRNNWIVFLEVECNLAARGSVAMHLLFETEENLVGSEPLNLPARGCKLLSS